MLRRLFATARGRQAFETLAADLGYDLVAHDWASPIPDLAAIDEEAWSRRSELVALPPMEVAQQLAHLEQLEPFLVEFRPPLTADEAAPGTFYRRNASFESVDADVLYATVRWARPRLVIEIGSGFSTLVLDQAARRNATDGDPARLVTIDPYPSPLIEPLETELHAVRGSEVSVSEFEALGAGDVLFCDTTHTVKLGSEVNHLILDVLPRLEPGVLVHFHDVFLPWEYPRKWPEQSRFYWSEQYLLQAFLAFNPAFEVLFSSQLVTRAEPERVARLIPGFEPGTSVPASFWLRRRDWARGR
jgi:hypothetical protein